MFPTVYGYTDTRYGSYARYGGMVFLLTKEYNNIITIFLSLFIIVTKVTVYSKIFTNNNMMDRTIKQQIKEYKLQLLRDKKEREQLLNAKTNWGALEQFIQKVNENPGLRVDVELRDGTVIHLQTTTKKQFDPYIGE